MPLKPQEKNLLDRAASVRTVSVEERKELGFSTRILVQCGLPHRDPGSEVLVWTRSNGHLQLSIQPKRYIKNGKEVCVGYPYGNIPRLLLLYVCSEAMRTRQRDITLGHSMSEFLRRIDLAVAGGVMRRLKEQTRRLFTASIDFTYDDGRLTRDMKASLASQIHLWWDQPHLEQANFSENFVVLTQEFYNEIIERPVPVDIGVVNAIKQSPLTLDLYVWLTHRVSYLRTPIKLSWADLAKQTGAEYNSVKEFGRYAREALRRIATFWPDLRIEEVPGGIRLLPASRPSVPIVKLGTN